MAQNSWPAPDYNDRAVTDAEYEQMAAAFTDNGVLGNPAQTQVVTAGSGLNVTIRANVTASVRGHFWTSGPTGDTLAVTPHLVGGGSRTDWVVLRLDRSTWTVRAAIRQGTAGAGAPALVQSTGDTGVYEIPLAQVTVRTAAASVTVDRYELYSGARVRACRSTTRNPRPVTGEVAQEIDTGTTRLWTGSSWQVLSDDSGVILVDSPLSAWSINVQSVVERRSGAVHLRLGSFERAAGTLDAEDESRLPVLIPSGYRHPSRDQYFIGYVTGTRISRGIIYSSASDRPGQVWLTNKPAIARGESVLPVSGISWVV
ncbi:hypothetical protein ACFXAZ_26130 [Streptomyces sp. NPDC059477]|uniref:hypothetical protein n=1 Tax=Streptomyces sp. NPDC059477 TaxID=3346847 RepID=UPI00369E5C4F